MPPPKTDVPKVRARRWTRSNTLVALAFLALTARMVISVFLNSVEPVPLAVFGDSLTHDARELIVGELTDAGYEVETFEAGDAGTVSEVAQLLETHPGDLPQDVLVAVGTAGADTYGLRKQTHDIAWLLDELGPDRRVVWVNIHHRDAGDDLDHPFNRFNAALEAVASGRPNVTVADWDAHVLEAGIVTRGDGYHYAAPAYALRATFYASALD